MTKTVKVKKGDKGLEVTKKAFEVVYKDHGFELVDNKTKRVEKKDGEDES